MERFFKSDLYKKITEPFHSIHTTAKYIIVFRWKTIAPQVDNALKKDIFDETYFLAKIKLF